MPKSPKSTVDKISKRPALVLIHGFRGSPIGLKSIADKLRSNGYDVYAPSIPPFAGAKKLSSYTPADYAKYLLDYCESHHLDRPILIGHSMGSIVAASTLQDYPDFFHQKAILLSPISARPAPFFRLIMPLSAVASRRLVDYTTTRYLFAAKDHKLLKQVLKITDECSSDHPPKKIEVFRSAKFSARYCLDNFNLTQNVLIIAGEHDHLIKAKDTQKLADKFHAELIFLPNSGHLHNYEAPHATAAEILKFLKASSKTQS